MAFINNGQQKRWISYRNQPGCFEKIQPAEDKD